MKLTCIIVDDEPLALDILEDYISRTPRLDLVGRFTDSGEALKFLNRRTGAGNEAGTDATARVAAVDLAFLDIQMPGLGGLEFAGQIGGGGASGSKAGMGGVHTRVIFTTAFPGYALEGFRVDALDYLLKPFGFAEFTRSVDRAVEWFGIKRAAESDPATSEARAAAGGTAYTEGGVRTTTGGAPKTLIVKSDYKQFVIPIDTISHIEGTRDYIRIYTLDDATGTTRAVRTLMNLKTVEETLPADRFARVHRSWIVNLDHVARIERGKVVLNVPQVGGTAESVSSPVIIPVSETYKEAFLRTLAARAL